MITGARVETRGMAGTVAVMVCVLSVLVAASGMEQAPECRPDPSIVTEVLDTREFKSRRESGAGLYLRWCLYRIRYWWNKHASRILPLLRSARVETILKVVQVSLILLLAAALFWFIWRLVYERPGKRTAVESFHVDHEAIVLFDPAEHRRLAAAAAAGGDFREAVRQIQLAALATLESSGVVRTSRWRTNWEYVAEARSKLPPPVIAGLEGVCRLFDLKWYGRRPCTFDDYQLAFALVGRLKEGVSH